MRLLLPLLTLLIIASSTAMAADDREWGHEHDHERARQLLGSSKVLPLEQISEMVSARFPGRIIDVELEEEYGTIIYELKVLNDAGELREIIVDAAKGTILDSELED